MSLLEPLPSAPLTVVRDDRVAPPGVALLDADPDLAMHIEPEQRARARAIVTTSVLELPAGPWDRAGLADEGEKTFGALVLSGLITRHLDVGGHPGLEFYGQGDVIGSWELEIATLPAEEAWTATVPSRLALLDDRFLAAVRRWPRLLTGLFQRTRLQHDRLALQLVIAEQPRVDERLLSLFWHLSERFGHVTPGGIVLSLALTHEALGRLIGARRPTVTLALKALADRDAVVRMPDRSWLVRERPRSLSPTEAGLSSRAQPVPLARPL
jgi:CRP/FNR family transcriptional regulator, cyclic AMP receptor protein